MRAGQEPPSLFRGRLAHRLGALSNWLGTRMTVFELEDLERWVLAPLDIELGRVHLVPASEAAEGPDRTWMQHECNSSLVSGRP